ncbi:sensor histidine kinase [Ohtaekwangia koreensis]|uniref:histidine kinase n=1 Tax=Ohtaekwangia koreensis TaxID=688867 RepID=A0A1T5JNE2_9BACT|nr:HAMP domain-containing sensor histidine kinase [Ohtaekwangia koreensis]SKC52884.1 Signal transduction histidine kinase [Ohtaekwangia koreensis]
MKFIYSIIFSGQHFTKTLTERRGVAISNAIGMSLLFLSLVLFVFYYIWYGWSIVTIAIPFVGLLAFGTVLLNRAGHIYSSRIWTCLIIPVIITALSIYSKTIYYSTPEELDYFTFRFIILGSCSFPWVLFSIYERKSLLFCSLAGVLILIGYDPLHELFGVGYSQDTLKASTYYFANVVIFISYCLLVSALAFLKWMSERNEIKNIELIAELNNTNEVLTEKNAEIEAQSSELQAQSEALEVNQKQLMNAYRMIEEHKNRLLTQNESLTSELLEKNKDLTQTNTELIKHNNELRQFSYTVSHNLRGPVASLLGLIHLLEPTLVKPEDSEILDHIRTSSERLDVIIKDLTKIIDIRHDIFKIRQKIDVEEEIDETFSIIQKEVKQSGISIIKNIETEYIYSVKPMMHSVLYNLINNAIKYRSAERSPVIEISSRENNQYYILQVQDNGLGIDLKRNKENLFKLYKRFHFHTEGKGLGLYLVKLQVEALGGYITVDSEINRYTTFTVYLKKPEDIQRQVLFKERHAEIFFDAHLNSTGIIWNGPITSDLYRSAFSKTLDFVKIYNTPNFITDLSRQGHIDKEDQLWMFHEIIPEAARNGLIRIAAIRPDAADDHIHDYLRSMNESILKLGIEQRFFLSMKEAAGWIESENEKIALKLKSNGNAD